MSYHTSGATIYHTGGYWSGTNPTHDHIFDANQSDSTNAYYELTQGGTVVGTDYGISFHSVSGGTEFRVNEGDNTSVPSTFKITRAGVQGSSLTSGLIEANDVLDLWGGNHEGQFTVTASMLFSSSGSGSTINPLSNSSGSGGSGSSSTTTRRSRSNFW